MARWLNKTEGSTITQTKSVGRKVAMVGAAALLALAAIAPAGVSAVVTYATVDGHSGFSAEKNNIEYWQTMWSTTCTKLDELGVDIYTVTQGYAHVVVKAGNDGAYANTIFNDVAAGETVFADTNNNNTSDPGGPAGDKQSGHIIFCGPVASPSPTVAPTAAPTAAPSFTGGAGGVTDQPPLPPTDRSGGLANVSDSLGLVLMLMAAALAGLMVLTPARRRR